MVYSNWTDEPLRILVVDDEHDTRRCLERLLRMSGHVVHTAGSYDAALDAASHHIFEIVICDIGLPGRDGWQLMRELKNRYRLVGIALSGFDAESDLSKSHDAGFAAHLTKPVIIEDLEAAISLVSRFLPTAWRSSPT